MKEDDVIPILQIRTPKPKWSKDVAQGDTASKGYLHYLNWDLFDFSASVINHWAAFTSTVYVFLNIKAIFILTFSILSHILYYYFKMLAWCLFA